MKNPRSLLSLLLVACLTTLAACGDDDGPAGPSAPVFDQITVSLDEIHVIRDCDADGPGEFSYIFYVVVLEDGEEVATYLDAAWNSVSVTDGGKWDPGVTTSFVLERRAGVQFNVRMRVRELDGAIEEFTQGTFVGHVNEDGRAPWSPSPSSGVTEWTLFDSAQGIGIIEWDYWASESCRGMLTYSVTREPAPAR
jgi:hypothetical protein